MIFENIKEGCEIQSNDGNKLRIDLIVKDGIYTSAWNQSLSKYHRLFFPNEMVKGQIQAGVRLLLDGKLQITKADFDKKLRDTYGDVDVLEFMTSTEGALDDTLIIKGLLKGGEKLYVAGLVECTFLNYTEDKSAFSIDIPVEKEILTVEVLMGDASIVSFSKGAKKKIVSLVDITKSRGLKSPEFLEIIN